MITKGIDSIASRDFSAGEVLLIDKTAGDTSFDVVYRIRKIIGVKKVGHAGTLDPSATGLLILCTGKKTKEISKFQEQSKTYTGIISLGKRTESFDADSDVIEEKSIAGIDSERIKAAIGEFVGWIEQIPPMYSALKHKGKALYKYARKGIEVERKPRKVLINRFEINRIEMPDIYFEIECSKGTYIRVIADDLGRNLGCGAYLKNLRRTKIGEYDVKDALSVDEFGDLFGSVFNSGS